MTRRPRPAWLLASSRAHLGTAGETYLTHLRFAASAGTLMVAAGLACLVHALIPALFTDKASHAVARLQQAMANRPAGGTVLEHSDADGLLTLLVLSVAAALLPWIGGMEIPIASSLSLLSLGFPAAALRAASREDPDEGEEGVPEWTRIWQPKGQPRSWSPHVAIVGAGFSGTMIAVQLAKLSDIRITLIDRRSEPARGLAYSTSEPNHLLNVRAAKMSAYPDDPGHFVRGLGARKLGGPFDFAPRRTYGAYLEEQLAGARAQTGSRLALLTAEAQDIAFDRGDARVLLDDQREIEADMVVLANGNPPPPPLPALAPLPREFRFDDPWKEGLAEGLTAEDVVLIVGTGLTMIDTVVTLVDAGFAGRIVAVSRRGLLPRVHAEYPPRSSSVRHGPYRHLSHLLRSVRRRAVDVGWRAAVDELRAATPELWRTLGDEERRRFLRHLRPWWDVHRHRIAPAVADRIQALTAACRFRTVAATIVGAEVRDGRAAVRLLLRGTHYCEQVEAARIVNCAGSDGDLRRTSDPLLKKLLAKGAIRADPHRLGIDIDRHGEILDANGQPTADFYAIGPIARGRDWEATAVPELRVQAAAMAVTIAARVAAQR